VYADDRAIDREIIRFVEDGLTLGEGVVVVTSAEHRVAIAAWCAENVSANDRDSLLVVDAEEALQAFMTTVVPDPELFEVAVGALLERAARGGRAVRVFGEMVGLLWASGNATGALALESLWNDIATTRRFFLLCAYPAELLDTAPLRLVDAMCERHSDLSLLGYSTQFADATTATSFRTERLLLPVPTAGAAARQVALQTVVDWGLPHLIEKCVTLTSELATKALCDAQTAFRLTLSRDATSLRIAVEDTVGDLPESDRPWLARIESMASTWGWNVTPDGKSVWADLVL
jgi:hypothetical protein